MGRIVIVISMASKYIYMEVFCVLLNVQVSKKEKPENLIEQPVFTHIQLPHTMTTSKHAKSRDYLSILYQI